MYRKFKAWLGLISSLVLLSAAFVIDSEAQIMVSTALVILFASLLAEAYENHE